MAFGKFEDANEAIAIPARAIVEIIEDKEKVSQPTIEPDPTTPATDSG